MRRALPLVLVSCAATHPATPVEHEASEVDPLGLVDGAPWKFTGERRTDHGVERRTLSTVLDHMEIADDGRRIYTVIGWPGTEPERRTVIVLDDGLVYVDGEPWLRIEPAYEAVPCEESYCWTVEPRDDGSVEVWYRTGPDVTRYGFRRGFGVTDFLYHHNGTTEDLELQRK